uniref:GCV_T domain-containing protein n=1 Tax=Steinernema glaseri TaxID=37863 RepID=A0A1I7YIG6_9BILA
MENLNLDHFVKVGDSDRMQELLNPLIGQVSVIDAVSSTQTNVILNGSKGKKMTLVIYKSRDDVYEILKFRQRQYVLLRGFGLKSLTDEGPLAITWEQNCVAERIGQTSLSSVEIFEENCHICSGVVALKEFVHEEYNGILRMTCTDHLGREIPFRAYNSHTGTSKLAAVFFEILKSNNAETGDLLKISNFCVVPFAEGRREYRLRKDSKIGFFSKYTALATQHPIDEMQVQLGGACAQGHYKAKRCPTVQYSFGY